MPVQRYSNACVEVSNNNFDEQKQQRLWFDDVKKPRVNPINIKRY